jgi:hypothetical protein
MVHRRERNSTVHSIHDGGPVIGEKPLNRKAQSVFDILGPNFKALLIPINQEFDLLLLISHPLENGKAALGVSQRGKICIRDQKDR